MFQDHEDPDYKPMERKVMKTQHTPTPWGILQVCDEVYIQPKGNEVLGGHYHTQDILKMTAKRDYANAAFIVRACNSHDELVAAAQKALDFIQSLPYEPAIAASTKAQDALVDALAAAKGDA